MSIRTVARLVCAVLMWGVMVGMGEQAGAFSAGNYSALSLNYASGPVTVGGAWEQQKDLLSVATRTWTTGGSLRCGEPTAASRRSMASVSTGSGIRCRS